MKNILFICQSAGFAGAESYALTLIRGMARREGIRCRLAHFYDGPLNAKLASESIETIPLFERDNLRSVLRLLAIVREKNIDLIHMIDLKSTIVAAPVAALCRVKSVSTLHGLPEFPKSRLRKIKYSVSLLLYFTILRFFTDQVILVSRDLQGKVAKFIDRSKSIVIRNGFDLESFAVRERGGARKGTGYVVGTVGRLERVKGHSVFIEAAKKILDRRDDVRFEIVGSGSLEEHLREKVRRLGIEGKIDFLGHCEDVRSRLSKMDVFVLPSLHEGIPYALLEAMGCGLPVICSRVGGVPEVIENESCGVLVEPGDVDAIQKAIMMLLDNEEYRSEVGANANRHIRQRFSASTFVSQVYENYRLLLGYSRS